MLHSLRDDSKGSTESEDSFLFVDSEEFVINLEMLFPLVFELRCDGSGGRTLQIITKHRSGSDTIFSLERIEISYFFPSKIEILVEKSRTQTLEFELLLCISHMFLFSFDNGLCDTVICFGVPETLFTEIITKSCLSKRSETLLDLFFLPERESILIFESDRELIANRCAEIECLTMKPITNHFRDCLKILHKFLVTDLDDVVRMDTDPLPSESMLIFESSDTDLLPR